jgi:voltage-gated sodium channel
MQILLHLVAFGPGTFIDDRWKAFDVVVALGTATGYIDNAESLSAFVKSFRILRVIRLLKMLKPIKVIIETLALCVPQLINIICLVIIVYTMVAVAATQVRTKISLSLSLSLCGQ